MKVFVVTLHLEYAGIVPETWVEGVFDTLEKAQSAMEEVFSKQVELNWGDIDEDDREYTESPTQKSLYDTCEANYLLVNIWEEEVE